MKDIATLATDTQLPAIQALADLTPQEQMQAIQTARQISAGAQVYVGKGLAQLKERSEHGQFAAILAEHNWHPRTAQRYIQFADFADLVAKTNPTALSQLDMTRWEVIRKQMDEETLQRFLSGEEVCGLTLAEAEEKGSRELKLAFEEHKKSSDADLQAAQKQIARLTADVEIAKNELTAAKAEASRSFSDLPFSPWVVAVREEASVHGDTANRSISGLSLALDQVQKHTASSLSNDEQAEYLAAAHLVYHQLVAVFSQSKQLLEYAHSFLDENQISHFDVALPLSEAELQARLAHYDKLKLNEDVLEQLRAQDRRAKKKNAAGRPTDKAPVYED